MSRQAITFVVDTERDRDIICWLTDQDNKSAAIREAIRTQLGRKLDITLSDIYEAIKDLKQAGVARETITESRRQEETYEPPDIAAALDSMGL
jgi:hypothetical protein